MKSILQQLKKDEKLNIHIAPHIKQNENIN